MKWTLAVAALLGVTLALSSTTSRLESKWFEPSNEYVFSYDAQISTGLPMVESQRAAQRISARVVLQIKDRSTAYLKLRDFTLYATQETLPRSGKMLTTEAFEPVELTDKQMEVLSLPIRFRYESGRVSELEFNTVEPVWSQNIKRAVVNMLYVNMEQPRDMIPDSIDKFFRQQETTLEGLCDVTYTKVEDRVQNEEYKEITKAIELDKCQRRPNLIYNIRFNDECTECDEHKQKTTEQSSTVLRFRVAGTQERFLIHSVELTSKYTFAPLRTEDPFVNTEVLGKLLLVESFAEKTKMSKIESSGVETLMHSQKTSKAREQWEMTGEEEFLEKMNEDGQYDVIEAGKKSLKQLEQLIEKEEVAPETTHMFSRLVDILRRSTYEQIKQLHQFTTQMNEKMEQIYLDSVATASTKVCVDYIVKLTVSEEISPVRAAYLIKSLVSMRLPSEKIIDQLFSLSQDRICEQNPVLMQTVRLTTGALINAQCGENPSEKRAHTEVCPREIKEKYVQKMNHVYKKASTRYEKVLALKMLANAAVDLSLPHLEKIIVDRREETTVRMQAMDALRSFRLQMPRRVQQILMPVYKARSEPTEMRITAAFHLLHTMPERMVLEQIVEQINKERNPQVAAYTYRLVKSFVATKNPCEQKFAERVKIAMRLLKNEKDFGRMFSSYFHKSYFSESLMSANTIDISTVFSNDSVLPKELMASWDALFGGQWNKHFLQVGITQQGVDRVLRQVLPRLQTVKSIDDVITRGKRSIFEKPMDLLQGLMSRLNIVARRRNNDAEKDPHATLYIRYKNLDFAVIPIDEEILTQLLKNVITGDKLNIEELERKLADGLKTVFTTGSMVYEVQRYIPTSFGMPIWLNTKMPVVAKIEGKIRADLLPKESRTIKGIKFEVEAEPKISTTHLLHSMIISPIAHTGVKIQNSVSIALPIDAVVEADWQSEKTRFDVRIKAPKQEKRILLAQTRPVTFVRKVSGEKREYLENTEKTIFVPRYENSLKEIDTIVGKDILGFGISLHGQVAGNIKNQELVPIYTSEKHIEARIIPSERMPREYKLSAEFELFNEERLPELSVFERFFEGRNKEHFKVEQYAEEESREDEEWEQERREIVKKSAEKLRGSDAWEHRVRFSMETVGLPAAKEHKAELKMRAVCDKTNMRVCKVELEGRRTPVWKHESDECSFNTNAHVMFPEIAGSLKQLREQKHREFHAVVKSEWGCESKKTNEMTVKIQGEQSKNMQKWIRSIQKAEESDVDMWRLLKEAGYLNQYKIDVDYSIEKTYEKTFTQVYRLLKAWKWYQLDFDFSNNEANRVKAIISVEPEERRYVNLTIIAPESALVLKEIRSPIRIPLINVYHPAEVRAYKARELSRAVCEVRSNKVRTFDSLVYRAPLTTCYSVIAKDCSEEPRFAVLVKKISKRSEEKKLKVVSQENIIEMMPIDSNDEQMKITVDGKKIGEEKYSRYNILKLADGVYKIELDSLSVRFDGRVARVEMSREMQTQQCGLCGHFDGQKDNEFRRADNEETDDIEEFHRSFLAKSTDSECEVEEEKLKEKKHYAVEETSSSEELSAFEEVDLASALIGDEEPVERQRVIEYASRTCFSKTAVKECPRGEPARTERVALRFVCFERHSAEALRLIKEVRRNFVDLSEYKDAFAHPIKAAVDCRA